MSTRGYICGYTRPANPYVAEIVSCFMKNREIDLKIVRFQVHYYRLSLTICMDIAVSLPCKVVLILDNCYDPMEQKLKNVNLYCIN